MGFFIRFKPVCGFGLGLQTSIVWNFGESKILDWPQHSSRLWPTLLDVISLYVCCCIDRFFKAFTLNFIPEGAALKRQLRARSSAGNNEFFTACHFFRSILINKKGVSKLAFNASTSERVCFCSAQYLESSRPTKRFCSR